MTPYFKGLVKLKKLTSLKIKSVDPKQNVHTLGACNMELWSYYLRFEIVVFEDYGFEKLKIGVVRILNSIKNN